MKQNEFSRARVKRSLEQKHIQSFSGEVQIEGATWKCYCRLYTSIYDTNKIISYR
jgi:hypothetical protein